MNPPAGGGDRFPRLNARTQRFTLGAPRSFQIAADGRMVTFLRSGSGTDPVNSLWVFDVESGTERLVADPAVLLADPDALPEAEARRRERARESASGIVAYSLDATGTNACFALGGRLFVSEIDTGKTVARHTAPGVFDPRLDPSGRFVAYVCGPTLRISDASGNDRVVAAEVAATVAWGSAEFIAAEEMGRNRGFWWAPDSSCLAVARVDNAPVTEWWVADAANPSVAPTAMRYPAPGSANADVELFLVELNGDRRPVIWDHDEFPYLADVTWVDGAPLTLTVQSRDQRTLVVLCVDLDSGETEQRWRQDDEHWVELTPGAPCWNGDRLVAIVDRDSARRLVVDGEPVTPPEVQVRAVVGTLGGDPVVTASVDPTATHLYRVGPGGVCDRLTDASGVHSGVAAGDTLVISATSMAWFGAQVSVRHRDEVVGTISSVAARPPVAPRGRFHVVGPRKLRSMVLVPRKAAGVPDGPLPVLVDPYGGPHAQRVVRARNAHLASQWFADQGFAVVVTDGRGTPGRGPEFERAVWGDLATPVLDDQVDALERLAAADERLDLTRVAIKGWSFGGYLAALAVLRRPDVFHAAIAGAPVTEWRLYDTHYTERYLGHPDEHPAHYERSTLLNDAASLRRPLMLIHGLSDDNVVSAHTFRLSAELLAHGRPHEVLPLSGVTHMTPQEEIAENLLLLQVDFLTRSLAHPRSG